MTLQNLSVYCLPFRCIINLRSQGTHLPVPLPLQLTSLANLMKLPIPSPSTQELRIPQEPWKWAHERMEWAQLFGPPPNRTALGDVFWKKMRRVVIAKKIYRRYKSYFNNRKTKKTSQLFLPHPKLLPLPRPLETSAAAPWHAVQQRRTAGPPNQHHGGVA